jgi:DNA modification methylase
MTKNNKTNKNIFTYNIWDTRRINEKIDKKIIDVIITSPPYWNLKDYKVVNQIGHDQSYNNYLQDLKNIFSYCSTIVKNTGSLWIIIDTFKYQNQLKLLPFDLSKEIQNEWKLQDIIIWAKDKTLPWSHKGRLRNIFEYILFFTKTDCSKFKYHIDKIKDPSDLKKWWVKYPERYNPLGKTPSRLWEIPYIKGDVWKIPIPAQGTWGNGWVRHSCPFPPQLIERILLLTTDENDVVLDPFAGSGSVLAQARVMKRKAIGFDINKEFKRMYEESVYPEIKRLWKLRKKELQKNDILQRSLEDTIKKLRKLKYPKDLLNKSIKIGLSREIISNLNSIFLINRKNEYDEPQMFLVFKDLVPDDKIVSELWKTNDSIPKWRYGFKPDIKIINQNDFVKKKKILKIPTRLFLYENGSTNYFTSSLTFDEWFQKDKLDDWTDEKKNSIPPILSNLEIREKEREL